MKERIDTLIEKYTSIESHPPKHMFISYRVHIELMMEAVLDVDTFIYTGGGLSYMYGDIKTFVLPIWTDTNKTILLAGEDAIYDVVKS